MVVRSVLWNANKIVVHANSATECVWKVEHDRVVGRILDWQIAGFGAAENFRVLLARKLAYRADSFTTAPPNSSMRAKK